MSKPRSRKFWIIFWTVSGLLLSAWYAYLNSDKIEVQKLAPIAEFIPFVGESGQDYVSAAKIADYVLKKDGREKTFLLLFQNNLELRPGGGFIGTFGVLKIRNGKMVSVETHDLSNFDALIPKGIEPPYPMKSALGIESWKMRDSNYSPDFEINAKKAEEFYRLGNGKEEFDGVIGMTTNVLESILKVTGPVTLPDYPGTYDFENGVISLEYQVEKAFEEQGISRKDRKSVMRELAEEIEKKVSSLSIGRKIELSKLLLDDLNKKEIQLFFKDSEIQNVVFDSNWAGKVNGRWAGDYLMMVDANLGSFKSDYYMRRSADYTVDFSGDIARAKLSITYKHTAKQRDWMTRNYFSYLRVYVPEGAWLSESKNFEEPRFGEDFGKKFFGGSVRVPLGEEKTVELEYDLPLGISKSNYDLLIQKQSGVLDVPIRVHIIEKDGLKKDYDLRMNSDIVLSELEK